MSLSTCDFSAAIEQRAVALGRQAPPDRILGLNLTLQSLASIETGAVTVSPDEGETVPFDAYLNAELARWPAATPSPAPAEQDEWVRVTIGTSTGWRKANDPMQRVVAAIQGEATKTTTSEASTWPNPWIKGKENRTRQQVIINTIPALAAKFKAEAKV